MDKQLTHHKKSINDEEVFLISRIIAGASNNPLDYEIVYISHSFFDNNNLDEEDIIGKTAKEIDDNNKSDSFMWLSFLMQANERIKEEFPICFFGATSQCYADSYFYNHDFLFIHVFKKTESDYYKVNKYIEDAPYGIFIANNMGEILYVNKQTRRISGYSSEEIIGRRILDFVAKEDYSRAIKDLFEQRSLKERFEAQYRCEHKYDGIRIWELSSVKLDENQFIGFINDVTELIASRTALKDSQERFKLLFEDAPLGYQSLNEDGIILTVNNAWAEMLGYEKDEVIGKPFNNFIVGDHVYYCMRKFQEFKSRGTSHANFEMLKKSGERIKVHLDGRISINENNGFFQTHCIIKDVTEQLIAERTLIDSEKKYSAMIQNMSDVIMILGDNAEITYASPNIESLFGWNSIDLLGQPGVMLVHHEDADYISAQFGELIKKHNEVSKMEFRVMCKNGETRNIDLVAKNLMKDKDISGVLLNFHDITERVRLEREKLEMDQYVRNQQKLNAIGTLASGIAHEINNPINGIMNYSQVILDDKNDSDIVESCANEILRETDRVSGIVRNLLDFSRQQKQEYSEADVSEIVAKTLSLIKTTLRHDGINLQIDIDKDLPKIKCKASQIQQVIMNLVTNARDSLNEKFPEEDDGKIIKIAAYEDNSNESFVCIEVSDTGNGIPADVQDRIFDPFFTTKDRDEGTGLGLSISHGIIKEHGGSLTFVTKRNHYTKFFINIPVSIKRD